MVAAVVDCKGDSGKGVSDVGRILPILRVLTVVVVTVHRQAVAADEVVVVAVAALILSADIILADGLREGWLVGNIDRMRIQAVSRLSDAVRIIKTELSKALLQYKDAREKYEWNNEKYKWIAIKAFQDNWGKDYPNFYERLKACLPKDSNKKDRGSVFTTYLAKDTILKLAQKDPKRVEEMFDSLFNKDEDYLDRIFSFQTSADELNKLYKVSKAQRTCQDEAAITTYLWLMYPDKYYPYRSTILEEVSLRLEGKDHYRCGKNYRADLSYNTALYNEP